MAKLEVCDLCGKEIMARFVDTAYTYTVRKHWYSYDGFMPYRQKTKLDVCLNCMRKIIDVAPAKLEVSNV